MHYKSNKSIIPAFLKVYQTLPGFTLISCFLFQMAYINFILEMVIVDLETFDTQKFVSMSPSVATVMYMALTGNLHLLY